MERIDMTKAHEKLDLMFNGVINEANRLRKLKKIHAPDVILEKQKKLVSHKVDVFCTSYILVKFEPEFIEEASKK